MRRLLCVFVGIGWLVSAAMAADQSTAKEHQKPAATTNSTTNPTMSPDMRRAIAFERAKDRADARQAAIEARHPTVFYNQADRSTGSEPRNPKKQ